MPESKKIFLTAKWRDLVMLNYEVDPSLLQRHVPAGTELDSFEGKTYVSLVGFYFSGTRLWGKIAVPMHTEFEEANLRFYVRQRAEGEERRGVCFIAEIVPRRAIAWTARSNSLRSTIGAIAGSEAAGVLNIAWRTIRGEWR
jgi:uncharacterized protein